MATTSAQDILAELEKLEKLAGSSTPTATTKSGKSSAPALIDTLAALEAALENAHRQILEDDLPIPVLAKTLIGEADKRRADVDKGLKEWYSGLSKVGKAVDKASSSCGHVHTRRLHTRTFPVFFARALTPSYSRSPRLMTIPRLSSPVKTPKRR